MNNENEKRSHTLEQIKIFLLGFIAALLIIAFLRPAPNLAIGADSYSSSTSQAGPLTAIGISLRNDNSGLYILNSQTSSLAYYTYENNKLSLRAARFIGYDMQLQDENDRNGISLSDAYKKYESLTKKGAK